ncbi:putative TetR family transcriptional regulator [Nocardia brasiliensis NBRC 14402]|uniref:TetR/AcrR family transcriptional regulator n=1 Tax=Nocardia brasiliensis TaxID=37326 RepID=UPI0002EA7EDD|nr:TetR/AcrR family transcriptional regulator [Nocardia brasiliensis]ASF07630.1 TetR family transcriptional regulator [Nocardia brasiliensis]GAJ81054.1 putative TetR family transcriptional regulator [Nocardia brasiliensis NBRC 14402]SUB54828.1 mycofactocin system transcriptional regulator [Nocardia brasiliensis]
MSDTGVDLDGRRLRTRRSREALSRAAFDLLNERGLDAVAVEDIAVRAGVTRRTFSRHFASITEAVLGEVDQDVHMFNEALCRRPLGESPLAAYRNAVHDWFDAEYGGARSARLARRWTLFQRFEDEPELFAGYQRIRVEGQRESVRIIAGRLGVDPVLDLRPAAAVAAGAGLLMAALQTWAAGDDPDRLPDLIDGYFDTLVALTTEFRNEESPS